jgi:hypothetical protein
MSKTAKPEQTKTGAQKDLKKQDTLEELPEEQVPPPPRTVVMLLDSYPEKMIDIREQIEREEEEKMIAQQKAAEEEEKKKKQKLQDSQLAGHNKSVHDNKSQVQEEVKNKRKDSADVKHLENEPLHFCYTQNKNVLNIDTSHGVHEIDQMIAESYHGVHVSFWVYFESIKYDHPSRPS